MKELDLLKKDWKKNEHSFEQVSEVEIYKMLHAKSSSIVKWIFVISILEFTILNGIAYLLPDEHHSHPFLIKTEHYTDILQIIGYGITFFFIFLFYKNYLSISATSTTKNLMETILKTRKTVKYYIIYNLAYIVIAMAFAFISMILYDPIVTEKNGKLYFTCFLIFLLVGIVVGIVWLFYRLLYGFLLKKLKRNYEELRKIDL